MSPVARGTSAGILLPVLFSVLIFVAGCTGAGKAGNSPTPAPSTIVTPVPPVTVVPTQVPATRSLDLSVPPPTAALVQIPGVDPIVGKWYAPIPDDLTFEFFADGTFRETSPAFKPYQGTWGISAEEEQGFYDAIILDRWGFRKQVHILFASGTLNIKSMGTLHRMG